MNGYVDVLARTAYEASGELADREHVGGNTEAKVPFNRLSEQEQHIWRNVAVAVRRVVGRIREVSTFDCEVYVKPYDKPGGDGVEGFGKVWCLDGVLALVEMTDGSQHWVDACRLRKLGEHKFQPLSAEAAE